MEYSLVEKCYDMSKYVSIYDIHQTMIQCFEISGIVLGMCFAVYLTFKGGKINE